MDWESVIRAERPVLPANPRPFDVKRGLPVTDPGLDRSTGAREQESRTGSPHSAGTSKDWSGRRGSNPRHAAWKAAALPAELLPRGAILPHGPACFPISVPGDANRNAAGPVGRRES